MSDMYHSNKFEIHPEFPYETIIGTIGCIQPKFLKNKDNDGNNARVGPSVGEVMARYMLCEDLAEQLSIYGFRKKLENPELTKEFDTERTLQWVGNKVANSKWLLSKAEQKWIIDRVREFL
jgi:hypothetical protein